MTTDKLNRLLASGSIKSYSFQTLDEYDNPIAVPGKGMRETEELTLTFPSGEVLVIGSFCSGCSENTVLILAD